MWTGSRPLARRPTPHGKPRTNGAPGSTGACGRATALGGYTAAEIASAYGFDDLYAAGDGGSGTTIALFELEPYSATDIASYQSCYGTNTSITNINVDGGPGSGVGSGEAALDIENLIGLAPQASILVYEGKNTGSGAYDTYRTIVSQNKAQVVSTSWGLCEPQEGSSAAGAENDLFIEAVTQGQTVFAASGDRGVQDCTGNHTSAPTVDDPASQPWVTGVGGTSLTSAGPPPTETAWNSSWNGGASSGAGGGGVSAFWGAPCLSVGLHHPPVIRDVHRHAQQVVPRGSRRVGRRRHRHRLRHLLEPPLVRLRRHERGGAHLGRPRRARQLLSSVQRADRRIRQPRALSGRKHLVRQLLQRRHLRQQLLWWAERLQRRGRL